MANPANKEKGTKADSVEKSTSTSAANANTNTKTKSLSISLTSDDEQPDKSQSLRSSAPTESAALDPKDNEVIGFWDELAQHQIAEIRQITGAVKVKNIFCIL